MALSFPNSSRSYDETHSRIRFLGYDGMFEVRFYVPAEVLTAGLSHWTASESDYLASFDALRSKILDAAKSAYKARPNRTITLALEHFK